MRNDLTDITIVVDRSGSMLVQDKNGVEEGFIHKAVGELPKYTLHPYDTTSLLDAVGTAIDAAIKSLAAMKEEDRPGLVAFLVVTDGLENSGHEYTRERVKEMIENQEKVYNWKFTFFGANQDAFDGSPSLKGRRQRLRRGTSAADLRYAYTENQRKQME